MVPLAQAPDAIRAHLLASLVESRGIETHVVGEHAAALGPYAGSGNATVLVRLVDFDRALAELKSFCAERDEQDRAAGVAARAHDRCPVCGYDLSGLDDRARCPECGTDQDALARIRQWIQLAPRPAAPGSLERTGAKLGLAVLLLAGIGLVIMVVLMFR